MKEIIEYVEKGKLLRFIADKRNSDTSSKIEYDKLIELISSYPSDKEVEKVEWISVQNQLPEVEGDYLVCVKFDLCDKLICDISTFYKGEFLVEREYSRSSCKVTHWMALPKLPNYDSSSKNTSVELIKCKHCEHSMIDVFDRRVCIRTPVMVEMQDDDFCSYGTPKILYKYSPSEKKLEPYEVPEDWKCVFNLSNMDELINCAECGKSIRYSDAHTSNLIQDKNGNRYCICGHCKFEEDLYD